MVNILTDIEVHEVSLVDKGANNKKILFKSEEGTNMSKKFISKEDEKEKALEGEGTTGPKAIGVDNNNEGDKPTADDEKLDREFAEKDGDEEKEDDEKEDDEKEDAEKEDDGKDGDKGISKSVRRKVTKAMIELEKAIEEKKELEKRLKEIEKAFHEEREKRIRKEFVELAKAEYVRLGNPDEVGLILKEASEKLSPQTYNKLTTMLKAANRRIDESLFVEVGKSGTAPGGSVVEKIKAIAKSYMESNPNMTMTQAEAKAWADNPELYREYQMSIRNRVI